MLKAETIHRMEALQERLVTFYMDVCDKAFGQDLKSKDGRGDTYWLLRASGAALTLAIRSQTMMDLALRPKGAPPDAPTPRDEEPDPEAEAVRYEKQAVALIERVKGRRGAPG